MMRRVDWPKPPWVKTADLDEIYREVWRMRNLSGVNGITVDQSPGGIVIKGEEKPVRILALLTDDGTESDGEADSDNHLLADGVVGWAWLEVRETDDGTADSVSGGLSGSFTLNPAVERNNNTSPRSGHIVELEQGPGQILDDGVVSFVWYFRGIRALVHVACNDAGGINEEWEDG